MDQYTTTYMKDYVWPVITADLKGHWLSNMGKDLDALAYETTYQHDYNQKKTTLEELRSPVEVRPDGKVECHPEFISRGVEGPLPPSSCPCSSGLGLDPRQPTMPDRSKGANLDTKCPCQPGGPTGINKEQIARAMYNQAEQQKQTTVCRDFPESMYKTDEDHQSTSYAKPKDAYYCPPPEGIRPLPPGKFGGQFEGPMKLPESFGAQFRSNRPCECPPSDKNLSGPVDYGKEWSRIGPMGRTVDPKLIGNDVPAEMVGVIKPPIPPARTAAPPLTDTCPPDQPSTFMRKLFEKYPYMYQLLQETPPEELISRVFRDRFISTYQHDYLHMGETSAQGQEPPPVEQTQKSGSPEDESEETKNIPGCPYTRKSKHGKKLSTIKKKGDDDINMDGDEKEEDAGTGDLGRKKPEVKEPPPISTYMDEISNLGRDIIEQKLYQQAKEREVNAAKAEEKKKK